MRSIHVTMDLLVMVGVTFCSTLLHFCIRKTFLLDSLSLLYIYIYINIYIYIYIHTHNR